MIPVKKPDVLSYHPEMAGNVLHVEKGWCHFSHEGTKDFLDYITGTMAACKEGQWCSATARAGLWHKGAMIVVVAVAAIADWIMVVIVEYVPIGLQWPGLLMPLVLAWYIITELGSILENAVKMGANVPAWLVGMLKASANLVESAGEKATGAENAVK